MGFITRFLASYSYSFAMALALWPAAAVALTLPILAWLYHRDGRLRLLSAAGAYLSVLYALGLVCFTLYPLPEGDAGPGITYGLEPILNPLHFIDDIRKDGIAPIAQLVANVALFVPLGFIAGRGLRLGLPAAAAIGFSCSLAIECAQLTGLFGIYPYAYRTFETTDLITNTAGALAGWAASRLVARVLPAAPDEQPEVTDRPGFVRRFVAFCIDLALAGALCLIVASLLSVACFLVGASFEALAALHLPELMSAACLAIVETAVPWKRGGQTPGGGFVRITCETRQRTGARRGAFYAARFAVLLCATGLPAFEPRLGLIPLACLAFYLFARKMPYDLI